MSDQTDRPTSAESSIDQITLKAIGEQPAMLSNLAYANLIANTNLSQQNAVSNQQAMNELGIAVTGKSVNIVSNLGPMEARSAVDILTNNELAQTIADLKATIQGFGRTTTTADGQPTGTTPALPDTTN